MSLYDKVYMTTVDMTQVCMTAVYMTRVCMINLYDKCLYDTSLYDMSLYDTSLYDIVSFGYLYRHVSYLCECSFYSFENQNETYFCAVYKI